MRTASDLNLLDFNVNNLSGSHWEGHFTSCPCNLRGSCPIYRARTTCLCFQYLLVAVTGCPQMHFGLADLLAPCKCHKLNFRVVEGVSPEGCCQIPGTDPASTGPTQAAACFFLKSVAVKGNSQQGAGCRNHSTSKRVSSCVPFFFPCPQATHCHAWSLTGITIMMWML